MSRWNSDPSAEFGCHGVEVFVSGLFTDVNGEASWKTLHVPLTLES